MSKGQSTSWIKMAVLTLIWCRNLSFIFQFPHACFNLNFATKIGVKSWKITVTYRFSKGIHFALFHSIQKKHLNFIFLVNTVEPTHLPFFCTAIARFWNVFLRSINLLLSSLLYFTMGSNIKADFTKYRLSVWSAVTLCRYPQKENLRMQ